MPESRIPRDDDRQSTDPDALRERAERAEREREVLRRENERLRQQVDHLKRQLDEARRAGDRQAAPVAKPLKKGPTRPGRKPGDAYGRSARRRVPSHIDELHDAPLPARCPGCGDRVVETGVATQYQEELPVPLAGDRLLILRETGELVMAEATPAAFRPIARAQILPATTRSYPALSDGFLYVRNNDTKSDTLICLDLRP